MFKAVAGYVRALQEAASLADLYDSGRIGLDDLRWTLVGGSSLRVDAMQVARRSDQVTAA